MLPILIGTGMVQYAQVLVLMDGSYKLLPDGGVVAWHAMLFDQGMLPILMGIRGRLYR